MEFKPARRAARSHFRSTYFSLPLLSCAVLFGAAVLNAQVSGSVTGTIVDATSASVPDATVSLQMHGSDKNAFSTKSSGDGAFTLTSVPPGDYDLVIEHAGFQKKVLNSLNVDPSRATSLAPIKLDIAGVTQTVEVSEAAQAVQASNAEVSTTISSAQIQSLPVINRSPLAFALTQAGVNLNSRGNTSINGQRPSYSNVTIDGINIQDNFIRTNDLDFLPNLLLVDQVGEVTISTSNASSAAYGGASQIAFVTPSGGNTYHGKAYWSNRNSYFAANTWFNNAATPAVKNPFLNQNQMGGVVSGPVIHNKIFFYSNYEAFRLVQQTSSNRTVLTDSARNGLFTYRGTDGVVRSVNILQAMGLQADATMQGLLAKVPTAYNNFNAGDSTAALLRNTAGYQFLQRNNRTRDNVTAKVDYLPSTKHSFTVSYLWNRDILDRPDLDTTFSAIPSVANNEATKLMSTSWRWSPKPNITNEFRFGFDWAPAVFLASQPIPAFFITGETYTNPVNTFRTQGRNTDTYNFQDNASWVKGAHTFSFGFQAQAARIEQYNDASITPTFVLGIGTGNTGLTNQLPFVSANDLSAANTLLATLGGYYTSDSQLFNVTSRTSGYVGNATNLRHDILNNYAIYGQDNWKVSRRLTASLGLRWDYYSPVTERDSLALLPVLQNNNPIQTLLSNSTLDFAGSSVGRPWYKSDKNNFAPNIGLAWDLFGNGKTALRAGYSISFVNDSIVRAVDNSQATNAGLQTTVGFSGLSGRVGNGVPTITPPAFKVPRTFADNYALNPSGNAQAMPDPGLVTPYVQQWSLGIQQETHGFLIEARYVGNRGTKEIRGLDFNQVLIGGILPDFKKAQNNGLLAQKAGKGFVPSYDPTIAGSQTLPFFSTLSSGGLLTNATIINLIQTGQVGELANTYQTNRLNGSANFYNNPYGLGMNLLENFSNSSYHALQIDVMHRFAKGFQFQANYSFSRLLSDAAGNQQTDFEPLLDMASANLERSRPSDFDITHVFKANGVYELPFGPGHKFNPGNPILNRLVTGWNTSALFDRQSGTPFSVTSGSRGTLNRAARSTNNEVNTTLDKGALDQLFGFRMTPNGPYYVAASAIGPDGRGVAADGAAPFAGQVFFQPAAGTVGSLQRNYFSGPWIWALDMKFSKVTKITERQSIELRMDVLNIFNHPNFTVGDQSVTSTTFGKITSTTNPLSATRRLVQFSVYYSF